MDSLQPSLLPCQRKAIANVKAQASSLKPEAVRTILHVLRMSNLDESGLEEIRHIIRHHARVAIHFHPDRPAQGQTVVRGLLESGVYKSQFETGISNGSVSAHPGGARDEWERRLFGGAYHESDAPPGSIRPKYGALDLMGNADGPAPRFGSCFLLLKSAVTARSTFTFGGSQDDPKCRGTADEFDAVLSALMEHCFVWDSALGVGGMRPPELVKRIKSLNMPVDAPARREFEGSTARPQSHNLDHMIESQVHGDIRLDRDVEALVVDPSFIGSEIGTGLENLSKKYEFPLRFHRGYQMRVLDIPLDFRGPSMPSLAARVARRGTVDADAIGKAVRHLSSEPGDWKDRGTYAEVLQELKLLWHVLVKYGEPVPTRS